MGAYWGSVWVAVLDSPETAYVEQVDKRPVGIAETSDDVCPVFLEGKDYLESFPRFDTEREAVNAVRRYRLTETHQCILELVVAIEIENNRLALTRLSKSDLDEAYYRDQLTQSRASLRDMQSELSNLRVLCKSRIDVR